MAYSAWGVCKLYCIGTSTTVVPYLSRLPTCTTTIPTGVWQLFSWTRLQLNMLNALQASAFFVLPSFSDWLAAVVSFEAWIYSIESVRHPIQVHSCLRWHSFSSSSLFFLPHGSEKRKKILFLPSTCYLAGWLLSSADLAGQLGRRPIWYRNGWLKKKNYYFTLLAIALPAWLAACLLSFSNSSP